MVRKWPILVALTNKLDPNKKEDGMKDELVFVCNEINRRYEMDLEVLRHRLRKVQRAARMHMTLGYLRSPVWCHPAAHEADIPACPRCYRAIGDDGCRRCSDE